MAERGIEKRGRIYHLRVRTPARYRRIEPRLEVTMSLGTDSLVEARARYALAQRDLHRRWEARLRDKEGPEPCRTWESRTAVLADAEPVLHVGPSLEPSFKVLLDRLDQLLEERRASPTAVPDHSQEERELPRILISEMPVHHERIRADRIAAKSARQLREWRNKYLRATEAFIAAAGDKPMTEITQRDARAYRAHWEAKRATDSLTTGYVNKQLGYMAQLVDSTRMPDFCRPIIATPSPVWRSRSAEANCARRKAESSPSR